MKVTVLVENTACKDIECAHGLSLFIETGAHKILFDSGPAGGLLLKNAAALGIDLSEADIAVLSHGHNDHSGGFAKFMEYNKSAELYMQRHAPEGHYSLTESGPVYNGIDSDLTEKYAFRITYCDDLLKIDDGLLLFSDVETSDLCSGSSKYLFEGTDDLKCPDRFLHEENLIVLENGRSFLFAGCAHRGIVNIVRRASELAPSPLLAVFGGFHLTDPRRKTDEPREFVEAVARELMKYPARFYTGHCTGEGPYRVLKELAGEQMNYMSTGAVFEL